MLAEWGLMRTHIVRIIDRARQAVQDSLQPLHSNSNSNSKVIEQQVGVRHYHYRYYRGSNPNLTLAEWSPGRAYALRLWKAVSW